MSGGEFRVLTVGWLPSTAERLWRGVGPGHEIRVAHLLHPRLAPGDWMSPPPHAGIHYFRRDPGCPAMPPPDRSLLASLEHEGVPSVHNMILGDRVVSKLPYEDALSYATFLARRLMASYESARPAAIISGFDGLHAGLSLGVARNLGIPWFALNFSVIPPGYAGFCDRMTPAARVPIAPERDRSELMALAESTLERFTARDLRAPAYVTPPPRAVAARVRRLPARIASAARILRDAPQRDFLRYTDSPARFSLAAAAARVRGSARAHGVTASLDALDAPPAGPFVLFGLHRQPEASTDVWAPYFSNQIWVIELLARSVPPTHRLLVKVHKSDAAKYSAAEFARMRSFPGVALVRPFAESRAFIERADLVVAIQGTMGLEAALLGRPVVMLGESPVTLLPGATRVGAITDLAALVRRKLEEAPPSRAAIVERFADYLAPFLPACHNDWAAPADAGEPARFAALFEALRRHVAAPARSGMLARPA